MQHLSLKSSQISVSLFLSLIIIYLIYMLKQTLNIVQFPILHEILIEIKDILKFQLNNYENNEDFIESFNKKNLDKKNFTIITNYSNKNFIKNPHNFVTLKLSAPSLVSLIKFEKPHI